MPLLRVVLIPMLFAVGCGSAHPPATRPAAATADGPSAALAPLQPISLLRLRAKFPDELRITVNPDGSYQISRRGGGGASSHTKGALTPEQRRELAAAFVGWDELETVYPNPGATEEEFQIEIKYGEKHVVASDAALNLPPKFREAYRLLRELLTANGML